MSPHETGEARPFPGGAHAFLEAAPLVPLRMDASSLAVDYVGSRGVALLGYPVERWSVAEAQSPKAPIPSSIGWSVPTVPSCGSRSG